jgi:hypothetical protein
MARTLIVVAVLGVQSSLWALDAHQKDPPKAHAQYLIHLRLEQQCEPCKTTKTLAAPTLAAPENVEFVCHVGSETKLAADGVPDGTTIKGRVSAADDGKVSFRGIVEVSQVDHATKQEWTRTTTAVHFQRAIKPGELTWFNLPATSSQQTLEVSIEKVTAMPQADATSHPATAVRQPIARRARDARR